MATDPAVSDLHSWVFILSATRGLNEVRRCWAFRDDLRQLEAIRRRSARSGAPSGHSVTSAVDTRSLVTHRG